MKGADSFASNSGHPTSHLTSPEADISDQIRRGENACLEAVESP